MTTPEGYKHVDELRTTYVCDRCGAIVLDPQLHDDWHLLSVTPISALFE